MDIIDTRVTAFFALICAVVVGIISLCTGKTMEQFSSMDAKQNEQPQQPPIVIGAKNVFLYWIGEPVPHLIMLLRELIYKHSKYGQAYKVHLINHDNLDKYVPASERPGCFKDLVPAHQADFIRIYCVCKYGGIWLDSDTLVMSDLSELFTHLETHEGFFVTEWGWICNGIFGSRAGTPFITQWLNDAKKILDDKQCQNIDWIEIGGKYLTKAREQGQLSGYYIIRGDESIYPVSPNDAVREFIEKPYDNYKTIVRQKTQPVIVLVSSVYHKINSMVKSPVEIRKLHTPLNYFIDKSYKALATQVLN